MIKNNEVGNVDSANGSNGTLNFAESGMVTGTIGATNALSAVNFSGSGAVAFTSKSPTFTIANVEAAITDSELMTGTVRYSAAGTIYANGGISGNAGTLNLTADAVGTIGAIQGLSEINCKSAKSVITGSINAHKITIGRDAKLTMKQLEKFHGTIEFMPGAEVVSEPLTISNKGNNGMITFNNDGMLQEVTYFSDESSVKHIGEVRLAAALDFQE